MAIALRRSRPISDINTTPLIDVLLVLLIMIILAIPAKQHSLDVPLPRDGPVKHDLVRNKVVVATDGTVLWNGGEVSLRKLSALLRATTGYPDEPALQFEPEPNASYDASVKVINAITDAGVEKFGFVGNEKYRTFGAG